MTITVFGASGKVGSLVIEEALRRGHAVVAFAHSQSNLPQKPGLSIKQGDVHDAKAVAEAIKGSAAVISALGSWGTPSKDILSAGMQNIIPAMESSAIERLISLSGSDARAAGDDLSLIHRLSRTAFKVIAGKVLSDGEKHIQLLEASALDWTVLRSPRMSKHGGGYQLTNKRPLPWASVGRQSVANCLVDLAEANQYARQAPYIARAN
jgi:putative NADH-flavin reductase